MATYHTHHREGRGGWDWYSRKSLAAAMSHAKGAVSRKWGRRSAVLVQERPSLKTWLVTADGVQRVPADYKKEGSE